MREYKSNFAKYSSFWYSLIVCSVIILIIASRFDSWSVISSCLVMGPLIFFCVWVVLIVKFTFFRITNEGRLECFLPGTSFRKKSIDIKSITSIRREHVSKGLRLLRRFSVPVLRLSWLNRYNQEEFIDVSYAIFNRKTLTQFLRDLRQLNPSIELDSYYKKITKDY